MKTRILSTIKILFFVIMLIIVGCKSPINNEKTESIADILIEEQIEEYEDIIEETNYENSEIDTYDTLDNWLMLGIGEDIIIDNGSLVSR